MKAGSGLLESSALWDMSYGTRPVRLCADLSSGSSGYQSGTSNTGRLLDPGALNYRPHEPGGGREMQLKALKTNKLIDNLNMSQY